MARFDMHHRPGGPDRRDPLDRIDSEFLEQGSILILRRKASGMAFNMNRPSALDARATFDRSVGESWRENSVG